MEHESVLESNPRLDMGNVPREGVMDIMEGEEHLNLAR